MSEKYDYFYIGLHGKVEAKSYNCNIRHYYDSNTDKIETLTRLEFPEYHKNKHWLRFTETNCFINSKGIYKNRFPYITDFIHRPDLSTFDGIYLVDKLFNLSVLLDSYGMPFNLIQLEEINDKNYVTELITYIMMDNKKDLAKLKLKL